MYEGFRDHLLILITTESIYTAIHVVPQCGTVISWCRGSWQISFIESVVLILVLIQYLPKLIGQWLRYRIWMLRLFVITTMGQSGLFWDRLWIFLGLLVDIFIKMPKSRKAWGEGGVVMMKQHWCRWSATLTQWQTLCERFLSMSLPSPHISSAPSHRRKRRACLRFSHKSLRGAVKYYFTDFVRKWGGGVPPKSVTPFSLKKIRKGGEGGTPQIRKLLFGPKSGVFEQKTQFLALFEENFSGKNS